MMGSRITDGAALFSTGLGCYHPEWAVAGPEGALDQALCWLHRNSRRGSAVRAYHGHEALTDVADIDDFWRNSGGCRYCKTVIRREREVNRLIWKLHR